MFLSHALQICHFIRFYDLSRRLNGRGEPCPIWGDRSDGREVGSNAEALEKPVVVLDLLFLDFLKSELKLAWSRRCVRLWQRPAPGDGLQQPGCVRDVPWEWVHLPRAAVS